MRARGRILTAIAVSSAVFLGGCSADEPGAELGCRYFGVVCGLT